MLVKPRPGWAFASAILGAVDAITRGLAVELAPIRVNSVCPGAVDTEVSTCYIRTVGYAAHTRSRKMWNMMPKEARTHMLKEAADKLLVKHVASPAEVAEAYIFLMK